MRSCTDTALTDSIQESYSGTIRENCSLVTYWIPLRFQIKPNRDLDIVDTNLALAWRSQHQLPLNSWALAEGIDNGNWKQLGMKASMSCIWQLIEYLSWSLSWQRLPFSSSLMNWYARLAGVLPPAACTWSWKASYVYLMFLLLVGDLEVGFRKWDEYFSNEQ